MIAGRPGTTADDDGRPGAKAFFAWALALEALSLAVFAATDVFLFYVVFEATLIPAYFLIGGFGGSAAAHAALKFLMYQLGGGLVHARLGDRSLRRLRRAAARPSYLLSRPAAARHRHDAERWLFVGFFIAFAIKAPLFPVHTWLADTTEQATPGTSVLLVCVLDKIGTYGMLRFCLGLLPRRLAVGDAGGDHARADLHRVRRAGGDRRRTTCCGCSATCR